MALSLDGENIENRQNRSKVSKQEKSIKFQW